MERKYFYYKKRFLSLATFLFYTCSNPGGGTSEGYNPAKDDKNLNQKQIQFNTLQKEVNDLKILRSLFEEFLKETNDEIEKFQRQETQNVKKIKILKEKKSNIQNDLYVLNDGISKFEELLKEKGLLEEGQKLSNLKDNLKNFLENKLAQLEDQITNLKQDKSSLKGQILQYIKNLRNVFGGFKTSIENNNKKIAQINQTLENEKKRIQADIENLKNPNLK